MVMSGGEWLEVVVIGEWLEVGVGVVTRMLGHISALLLAGLILSATLTGTIHIHFVFQSLCTKVKKVPSYENFNGPGRKGGTLYTCSNNS